MHIGTVISRRLKNNMDKMDIKITIIGTNDNTQVKFLVNGQASRSGLVHAISEFLMGMKQSTNLALVTDGIEEFCESLERMKNDENIL